MANGNNTASIGFEMKFADVIAPKSLCKDITGVGRWGNGDVEVGWDSLDILDDVTAIIEQAFRLQDVYQTLQSRVGVRKREN